MRYEIEIRKRAEKDLAMIPKQEDLEDYTDLKDLRKAKKDPMNQQGRLFNDVAKELGLKRKKIFK